MIPSDYEKTFRLDGKVALVTGGAGIIGKEVCRGLVAMGARVAVVDRLEQAALDTARELGPQAAGFGCDVADSASVRDTVKAVTTHFGRLDVLHNNAATKTADLEKFFAPFETYSLDTWREVMGVNVDGMFLMAQAVGKWMVDHQTTGSLIQTASIYGVVAPDQRIYEGSRYLDRAINTPAVYSVSKAAVLGLTRHLATYWGPKGIRVNSVTPGGVESGQNEEFNRRYSYRVPLGRMAQASEIVSAVLYLASDASRYVNGHNLIVDGGLSVW